MDRYIGKIFVTPENGALRLEIWLFTGETTSKYLENFRSHTGHASEKMIHAFDMVRCLTGSEAAEFSAVGACLVNPRLRKESGIPDVDTAVVTMRMENGCIAVINNFRQAVYGYDQRVEVLSSRGMASDTNELNNTAAILTVGGCRTDRPQWFFLKRYPQAFIDQVLNISWLSITAGVSRSGYYHCLTSERSRQQGEERDQKDFRGFKSPQFYNVSPSSD